MGRDRFFISPLGTGRVFCGRRTFHDEYLYYTSVGPYHGQLRRAYNPKMAIEWMIENGWIEVERAVYIENRPARVRATKRERKSMKNVDEVVDHTKGSNIISLGHGFHIRITSFAIRKETSDRLDFSIQISCIGASDTIWCFPDHLYFSYTKGDPHPVIRKHGPENDRPIIICAEMLGFYMKEYLKKNYKNLYRRYMLGSKKPSVYKKRRKSDA